VRVHKSIGAPGPAQPKGLARYLPSTLFEKDLTFYCLFFCVDNSTAVSQFLSVPPGVWVYCDPTEEQKSYAIPQVFCAKLRSSYRAQ
jgi:hypothetical protein